MSSPSPFSDRQSTGLWCRIAGGKVIRSAKEDTPGAVKVEKKNSQGQGTGEFRWELHNDEISGKIIRFERKEQTFNGEVSYNLVVALYHAASDTRVNVQLKEGDRYWRGLMTRLPNVDLSEAITLSPYDFKPEDDGRKIGLNVSQRGEKIQPAFTKDAPNGLPPMQRVMFKGKERADFTEQDDWLNKNVLLPVNAKLAALVNVAATAAPVPVADDDDLPPMDPLPF